MYCSLDANGVGHGVVATLEWFNETGGMRHALCPAKPMPANASTINSANAKLPILADVRTGRLQPRNNTAFRARVADNVCF